ncbi:MAG TPA: CARDB domain-containing protein [Candidatus Thermoplasmatota archaeon]|nr:CARDB domain-containing protein [Candidatus Thermoplasmatota archaeon]
MRSRQNLVVVCLLILLAADIAVPLASGYHEREKIADGSSEAPETPLPVPSTVEQVRRDALAALDESAREIGRLAGQAGIELALPPPLPSPVFVDGMDPGTRQGGYGDYAEIGRRSWIVAEGAGWNGSAGRAVSGPDAAGYAGGERLLVSPAIDLSAYPLAICGTPFLCADISDIPLNSACVAYVLVWGRLYAPSRPQAGDPTGGIPLRACLEAADLRHADALRLGAIDDQVNLILKHRFNIARDIDGAQIWGFPFDPVDKLNSGMPLANIYRAGKLLVPLNGSSYTPQVAGLMNQPGFTGARDWETLVFDITPYAGQKIHLGFRFVASQRADSEGPSYFRTPTFDRPTDFGWTIDDLEILGPALQNDAKVHAIDVPSMRKGDDVTEYIARDEPINVTATVLNAASLEQRLRVTFTVTGLSGGDLTASQEATLAPGAVWTPSLALRTPAAEGAKVSVTVKAETLAKGGGAMTDPTPENNAKVQEYVVSTIRNIVADLSIPPSSAMVDEDEPVEASGVLHNRGNSAEILTWRITDTSTPKTIEAATGVIVLKPGTSADWKWTLRSADRGQHNVTFTAASAGLVARDVAHYYVRSSPPPLFADLDRVPDPGWLPVEGSAPEVFDGGYWGKGPANNQAQTSFHVLPLPLTYPRYQDLKLTMRYMTDRSAIVVDFAPRGAISVGPRETLYGDAANEPLVVWSSGPVSPRGRAVWQEIRYVDTPEASARRLIEEDRTWHYFSTDIMPEAGRGYFNLWNPSLYELRIKQVLLSGDVFIDDLRVTGVPEGGLEKDRVELFRLTGDESDLIYPPRTQTYTVGAMRDVGYRDGWYLVNATMAKQASEQGFAVIQWTNRTNLGQPHRFTGFDNAPVLWQGFFFDNSRHPLDTRNIQISQNATRLISPSLVLQGAVDPVLRFEHEYGFQGAIDDLAAAPRYFMHRTSTVDLSYKRSDGQWSSWIRLEPVGNYPHYFETTANGMRREPATHGAGTFFRGGDGYFWPGPCTFPTAWCTNTVSQTLLGPDGNPYLWDLPTSRREPAMFRLRDQPALSEIDLEGLEVRFAFHISAREFLPLDRTDTSLWRIGSVQVDPVSTFAVDAAITNVDIPVAYDWRLLGLGPGSVIPINVTLANVGLFREDFTARIEVRRLGGETVAEFESRAGELLPGESRNIVVRAQIPHGEDILYEIVVTALPSNGTAARDENAWNDVVAIGRDGSLFAKTRIDLNAWNGVFPTDGRTTLPRVLSTGIRNLGNIAVPDAELRQRIERITDRGAVLVSEHVWKLEDAIVADPTSVTLARLLKSPLAEDVAFFTPGEPGNFVVTFEVVLPPEYRDHNPDDNLHRSFLTATEAIIADDFESGLAAWTTNGDALWSSGDGFRGGRALVGGNASGGLVKADAHGWIESPTIPLANLREAKINFLARYDLEDAYDGVTAEYLGENGWVSIAPARRDGALGAYPSQIVGSNPISRSTSPERWLPAFSGNSRASEFNLDGWTPVSFDLSHVPELTETVTLMNVEIPSLAGEPILPAGREVYVPRSLANASSEDRWEILNLTETMRRTNGDAFWWTGRSAAPPAGIIRSTETLSRQIDISSIPANATLSVTWRDWRAGRTGEWWTGVGMSVDVTAFQLINNVPTANLAATPIRLLEVSEDGQWHTLTRTFEGYNPAQTFVLNFVAQRHQTAINDLGWAVENVTVNAVVNRDGRPVVVQSFIGADDSAAEIAAWTTTGQWQRAVGIASRPATWSSTVRAGPDGVPIPAWTFGLNPATRLNVDTRLVTPVVNLTSVQGTRASLDILHRHQLLFLDGAAAPLFDNTIARTTPNWTTNRAYQAGVVEVSLYNRSTQRWDAWKQLFADSEGPSQARRPAPFRVATGEPAGAPYTATLPDAGDTFDRFVRNLTQRYGRATIIAFDAFEVPTSFVFSGNSAGNGQTWVPARFDLTPYIGEQVRFAFHGWSGGQWGGGEPGPANRFWEIADIRVVGEALSGPDTKLRFRLGTDATGREGSLEIDQFEVLGHPYDRSVALTLDAPAAIGSTDPAAVRVAIRNHGADERRFVAVGVREVRSEPPSQINVVAAPITQATGYRAVAGPFRLAPAGEAGSTADFEFLIYPRSGQNLHRLAFEVLDGYLTPNGLAYAPARDDVPHRALRVVELPTADITNVVITNLANAPTLVQEPGNFTVSGVLENRGTTTAHAAIQVRVEKAGTTPPLEIARFTLPTASTMPRTTRAFVTPNVTVTEPGNYIVRVSVLRITPLATTTLHVAPDHLVKVSTNEVRWTSFFEDGTDGWMLANGVRRDDGRAASGRWSLLYGATDAEYASGSRLGGATFPQTVTIVTPPIDLRGLGNRPMLAFKHLPMLGNGIVLVQATVQGCNSWSTLAALPPGMTTTGRLSDWQSVLMDLSTANPFCGGPTSLVGRVVLVRFVVAGNDQGWRLDDVAVMASVPTATPPTWVARITDEAHKVYAYRVDNPGASRIRVAFELDRERSGLLPDQLGWFTFEPAILEIEPRSHGIVNMHVRTPASRDNVLGRLIPIVRYFNTDIPEVSRTFRADLTFDPRPRADLSVSALVDGRAPSVRIAVEEAMPHELTAIIRNRGDASTPTLPILFQVSSDESKEVVWEARGDVEGLPPITQSEESTVVSVSWKPAFGSRGNRTLTVVVDPDRSTPDVDRSNNRISIPLEVVPIIRPDLSIAPQDVAFTTLAGDPLFEAAPGELIRVQATGRNLGLSSARAVTLSIISGSTILGQETWDIVEPGRSFTLSLTQFAPAEPSTYRFLVTTQDLEGRSENNQIDVEVPIYPPELVVPRSSKPHPLRPGQPASIVSEFENAGPFPLLLNLSGTLEGGSVLLNPARLALAPGEKRSVELSIATRSDLAPGLHLVRVLATGPGFKAVRTFPVESEANPALAVTVHPAQATTVAKIQYDAVNVGNVAIEPVVVLRARDGAELARSDSPRLAPGSSRLGSLTWKLPPGTPPGTIEGELIVLDGKLERARGPVSIEVAAWGRVRGQVVEEGRDERGARRYALDLAYEGNAPSTRSLALYGLAAGDGRFNRSIVDLAPGRSERILLTVTPASAPATGLRALQVALIDPAGTAPAIETTDLVEVLMDNRNPNLQLKSAERGSVDVAANEMVTYHASIRNTGDAEARNVSVRLFVDGLLVDHKVVPAIGAGIEDRVTLEWRAKAGAHAVAILVSDPASASPPAFAESVEVKAALVEIPKSIPNAGPLFALAVLALAFAARRRAGR